MPARLADIAALIEPVRLEMTVGAVFNRFESDAELFAIPVVENGAPIGLITRTRMAELLAATEGRQLLGMRAIKSIMNSNFRRVRVDVPVAALAMRAAETNARALEDGVVLVREGYYAGFVTPSAILAAIARENAGRARALKSAKEKIDSAREAASNTAQHQSRFLAMLSHEIRTPLSGILSVADLLVDTKLSKQSMDYARTIASSGRVLDRMLTDMLDLSRMEAGKLTLNKEPLTLRDFANEARDLWGAKTVDKNVSLRVSVARGTEKRVVVDAMRLRQVLFNLISNALKFTDKGYVEVELSTRQGDDGELALSMIVKDSGCGIADEHKARLFEEFEQATPETAALHGGTGLGLAIAKGLTELMGGTITLSDNPEGGSIFTVEIGVERMGPRLAIDNPVQLRRGRLELGDILVIEDHRVSQMVMEKALSAAGWNVDCVFTGEQGIRRAGGKRYQAILVDRHLPDEKGEAVLARIRSEALVCQDVPVMLVTADVSPERREASLKAGFDGFIAKPIRPRELVAALADIVMRQEAGQIVRRVNAV